MGCIANDTTRRYADMPPSGAAAADPRGLFRRSGGPGVAEGGDHLLYEAVEVFELDVEEGAEGVAQMKRSRPG